MDSIEKFPLKNRNRIAKTKELNYKQIYGRDAETHIEKRRKNFERISWKLLFKFWEDHEIKKEEEREEKEIQELFDLYDKIENTLCFKDCF